MYSMYTVYCEALFFFCVDWL